MGIFSFHDFCFHPCTYRLFFSGSPIFFSWPSSLCVFVFSSFYLALMFFLPPPITFLTLPPQLIRPIETHLVSVKIQFLFIVFLLVFLFIRDGYSILNYFYNEKFLFYVNLTVFTACTFHRQSGVFFIEPVLKITLPNSCSKTMEGAIDQKGWKTTMRCRLFGPIFTLCCCCFLFSH